MQDQQLKKFTQHLNMLSLDNVSSVVIYDKGDLKGMPCVVVTLSDYQNTKTLEKTTVQKVLDEILYRTNNRTDILIVLEGFSAINQPVNSMYELAVALMRKAYVTMLVSDGAKDITLVSNAVDYLHCYPRVPFSECEIDWQEVTCLRIELSDDDTDTDTDTAITPENFEKGLSQLPYLHDNITRFVAGKDSEQKVKELGIPWRVCNES